MEKGFTLEILTPEKTVFTGRITSLIAPGALGYLGVLANHAPLTATLTPGKIITRDAAGRTATIHSKSSGFLQVHHNQVTLLADEIAS